MKYYLRNDVRYIKGKHNSALYDLKSGKIFSQNYDATKILDFVLENDLSNEDVKGIEYIEKLLNYDLISLDPYIKETEQNINTQLKYVWLELTSKCNFDCIHCYGSFGHPDNKDSKKELNLNQWKEVLSKIRLAGGNAIQLIGGEPLLFKDIVPLLEYIHELKFSIVDVLTNGFLLTDDFLDGIEKISANLRVSLYGHNADIHDAITKCPGSFSSLDKVLNKIKIRKIDLSIAVILMNENQDYLEEIKKYIESKGFAYKGFDIIRSVSSKDLYEHRVTRLDRLKGRYIYKANFAINKTIYNQNIQWNSCWFGKFAITALGDVIPCVFARDCVCGNILSDSEEKIKESLLYYWKITKDDVKDCKDCEFRYACSDCRPLSKSIDGDLFAKYPRCCYDIKKK